ncbi:M28 family peptidase [Bacillus subtilis]|uniref:M28 family peptidase n=1 Tax=Bacillus subtilis TaxID=1423 RepID=UPI0021499CE8|nr:M28 family peptidase [Bacillus subtilis]MCR1991742.1 M28 family peptidase [Bacillus subtilis]
MSKKLSIINNKKYLIFLYLFLVISFTLFLEAPSKPVREGASPEVFSSIRAMDHTEKISQKPRPTGSEANEKTRNYIVEELQKLGLTTKIEGFNGEFDNEFFKGKIELKNIIGVLEGYDPQGKSLMLTAHYDSVATGPGANDNGANVGVLLEVARALINGPQLKNNVYFVFPDAEEKGLLGARAFWKNEKYINDIGMVLNFEARGSKGPSIMYQTSNYNGKLIKEFAQNASSPVANSFLGDLYKILPNDTDLTISLDKGIPGMNFAYLDGWEAYHMPFDDVENVNQSSVQHQGENALAMVDALGNINLTNIEEPNQVYFTLFSKLFYYPESFVEPYTLTLFLLTLLLTFYALRKKVIHLKGLAESSITVISTIIISLASCFLLYKLVFLLWANNMSLFNGATHYSIFYKVCYVLLTLIIYNLIYQKIKYRVSISEMINTGMWFCLILLFLTTYFLPGASYLFALPLSILIIVFVFLLIFSSNESVLFYKTIIMVVISILPLALFTALFHLLFIGLDSLSNIAVVTLIPIILAILDPINRLITIRLKTFVLSTTFLIIILLGISYGLTVFNEKPVYKNEDILIEKFESEIIEY